MSKLDEFIDLRCQGMTQPQRMSDMQTVILEILRVAEEEQVRIQKVYGYTSSLFVGAQMVVNKLKQ